MVQPPRRTRAVVGIVGVGVLGLVVLGLVSFLPVHAPDARTGAVPGSPKSSTCVVASPTGRLHLDPAQAENATTIAAVAKRDGFADHAVTVALVAALQESKLRNLDHGDLDSLGLFQQRPSQGWGLPSQLLVPRFAAAAFYAALGKVPGWEAMPVGDAAQAVQRSNAPGAYGPWEHQARLLADALTGETAAAFSCRFVTQGPAGDPGSLEAAMAEELGPPALGSPLPPAQGWTGASWLVAHAATYHIVSVRFLDQLWTSASGEWRPLAPSKPYLEVARS